MNILLATDGSRHARHAEDLLKRFPFPGKVNLQIATVCPPPDLHSITAVPQAIQSIVDACRDESQKLLDQAAARCAGWAGSVTTKLLDGHPGAELLRHAEEIGAALIVIGARGLGAMSRFLLGSVSERVAKFAHCPVLIARPHRDSVEIERIFIACDESRMSNAAIDRFAGYPLGEKRSVHLHTTVAAIPLYGIETSLALETATSEMSTAARNHLAEAEAKMRRATPNVTTSWRGSHDVAGDLLDVAADRDADLIVLGGSGKNAIERFFLGSVSLRVLHHAPASIWIERH